MMNFSPTNEQGLLSLVEALRHGMDPNVGYQVLGDIQNQQASMIAQRQERLGGLADLLMGAASQGMPEAGAEALLQAAPGPAGPAAQNILQSLYPTGDIPQQSQLMASTGADGSMSAQRVSPEQMYGSTQSPAYQLPPPSEAMQMAAMEQQQTAASDSDWGVFQQFMAQARAKEIDPQTAYTMWVQQGPDNAALVASDQARVKGILGATFGQAALLGVAQ
jgi:hypothetical protein